MTEPTIAPSTPVPGRTWTCPMHPEVQQEVPGTCPKCGMALVPSEPPTAPDTHHRGAG